MSKYLNIFIFYLSLSCSTYGNASDISLMEMPKTVRWNRRLVVIIPAKNYSMKKPLFKMMTSLLLEKGFAVGRFNWSFYVKGREPSKGFVVERSEIRKHIETFQKRLKIDSIRTTVIAKSFGSRVLAKSDLSIFNHLALLTPNCSKSDTFGKVYGNIFGAQKDILISISTLDPYCPISQIYKFLEVADSNTQIYTTFGDHNFKLSKNSVENQRLLTKTVVHWVSSVGMRHH